MALLGQPWEEPRQGGWSSGVLALCSCLSLCPCASPGLWSFHELIGLGGAGQGIICTSPPTIVSLLRQWPCSRALSHNLTAWAINYFTFLTDSPSTLYTLSSKIWAQLGVPNLAKPDSCHSFNFPHISNSESLFPSQDCFSTFPK